VSSSHNQNHQPKIFVNSKSNTNINRFQYPLSRNKKSPTVVQNMKNNPKSDSELFKLIYESTQNIRPVEVEPNRSTSYSGTFL
jgi:hypothetical protein